MPCRNGTCRISIRGSKAPPFKADLARAEAECKAFAEAYRGKLDAMAHGDRMRRSDSARRCKRYEAVEDLLGRLMSYAGPRLFRRHHGSGARQVLRRHAGAAHGGVERALVLRARAQPHRRRGASTRRRRTSRSRHYRPWIEDLRKDKPYQLDDKHRAALPREVGDRARRLEPPVRRDHRVPALQRRRRGTARSSRRSTSCRMRTRRSARTRRTRLRRTFRANLRTFTLITNTLAKDKEISDRWRGFEDVADSRHLANRVEREVVDALVARGARGLSAPVASLLRAEGEVVRQGQARSLGPQRAAAESRAAHDRLGRGAATRCSPPIRPSRRGWPTSRGASSTRTGSMRRRGPARRLAPSRIRPCLRRIPTCC